MTEPIKLEVGKAYMTGTNHLALVYRYNPEQYPPMSRYSNHMYSAILLRITGPVTVLESFTEEGMYASGPTSADIAKEATLEELDVYLTENKTQLCERSHIPYIETFYKAWKEKNP